MDMGRPYQIAAVSVNHNTSAYMELMLRSLFACHPPGLPLSLTIFDNGSTDDMQALRRYASKMDVPILPSGFLVKTMNNSHGEVLRRFVLDQPDCTHYLFLDADVRFIEANTIPTMLGELGQAPDAFGIGPRMSWNGIDEIPLAIRQGNPDVCDARLHPCCALVANTDLFRRIVDEIGLSSLSYHWAERDEILDTFKLMTRVMQTHGLRHIISSVMVQHFFSVSYDWDGEETIQHKIGMRDRFLHELRMHAGDDAA